MTQYLVAIYRPKNYDPAVSEDEAMDREIDALNNEMKAAGVSVFVGGLQPESSARSLRLQAAGKVLITRRAVRGNQGTHRRFLGAESC
jgi:hypothetical protein